MKNYSWNSSTFDRNFKPYSDLKNYREFDPDSVMMFNFGAESLSDGKAITGGDNLSPSDLALIRRLYPKSN